MTTSKLYAIPDRFLKDFTVWCSVRDYRNEPSDVWHWHDFEELVLVLSGTGKHITEDGAYPIRKGDAFLISHGKAHGYEDLHQLRIANVLFRKDFPKSNFKDLADSPGYHIFFENSMRFKEPFRFRNALTLSENDLRECGNLCARMRMEQSGNLPGRILGNELLFLSLCTILCRSFSLSEDRTRSSEIGDLSRLIQFMEQHYPEDLSLAQLARQVNRSVSSLTALFRKGMDSSPMDYLNKIRLERAAVLLRESELPISIVAFRNGFSDSNYFSTRFSKHFGASPREYRKREREF